MDNNDVDVITTTFEDQLFVEKAIIPAKEESSAIFVKIEFTIDSNADSAVAGELIDTLPPGWPESKIGFPPDHEADQWSIEDGVVVYEFEIPPAGKQSTMYAVRVEDKSELDLFRHPVDVEAESVSMSAIETSNDAGDTPTSNIYEELRQQIADIDYSDGGGWEHPQVGVIGQGQSAEEAFTASESADMLSADDAEAPQANENTTEHIGSDTTEDETGVDDGWSDHEVSDEQPVLDLGEGDADPFAQDETSGAQEDESRDLTAPPLTRGGAGGEVATEADFETSHVDSGDADEVGRVDRDELVDELIVALREEASSEQIDALSEELDRNASASIVARIDYLEREYSELAAYKESMRDYLDSEERREEAVEAVQDRQAQLEQRLDEQAGQVADAVDRLDDVEGVGERIDTIEDRVDGIGGRIDSTQEDLETLDTRLSGELDRAHGRIDDIDDLVDELDATSEELEGLDERLSATVEEVNSLSDRLDENLTDEVDDLSDRLEELAEDVEGGLAQVRNDLAVVQNDLEDTQMWKDQLQEIFSNLGQHQEGPTNDET